MSDTFHWIIHSKCILKSYINYRLCVCVCVCRPKTAIYPCIKQIFSLSIMFIIRNKQTKQQKCKISSPILLLYWAIVYLCFEENCMIELPTFFFDFLIQKRKPHTENGHRKSSKMVFSICVFIMKKLMILSTDKCCTLAWQ